MTQYSNEPAKAAEQLLGDGSNFQYDTVPSMRVPILYARIEDLSPAGIATWEDLEKIASARLMLDTDVLPPVNPAM